MHTQMREVAYPLDDAADADDDGYGPMGLMPGFASGMGLAEGPEEGRRVPHGFVSGADTPAGGMYGGGGTAGGRDAAAQASVYSSAPATPPPEPASWQQRIPPADKAAAGAAAAALAGAGAAGPGPGAALGDGMALLTPPGTDGGAAPGSHPHPGPLVLPPASAATASSVFAAAANGDYFSRASSTLNGLSGGGVAGLSWAAGGGGAAGLLPGMQPSRAIVQMSYCEVSKVVVMVTADGACAVCGASEGGLSPLSQLCFGRWLCGPARRAVCGAVGVRAQLIAVGRDNGEVDMYR